MSSPKKPMPEQVATRLANPLPGQGQAGGVDRRTAALPQAPVPIAAPHARTMEWDPYGPGGPGRRAPMATVMTTPQVDHPSHLGRWIGGPVVAAIFAALTIYVSAIVNPIQPAAAKNRGHLRLSSDPEGATVLIEGKVHPRATPTTIDGEIGATLRIGFKLDGYIDKEADVFVGEGERPFRAKLEKREVIVPTPEPAPTPQNLEPPTPTPVAKEEPHKKKEPVKHERPTPTIAAAPGASGTLSVHVRPWAIVYVDGAKIHQTPVDGEILTAGLHVIELVNEDIKKKEKVTVEVRANGAEEVRRNWEK